MNKKMISRRALAVPMGALLGVAGLVASGAMAAPAGASGLAPATTAPTTTTVKSSLDPSSYGGSVTFTAHVASPTATVTGNVTFSSGGTAINGCTSVTLGASQSATCTTSTLPVGSDVVTAKYAGTAGFATSSGTVTQMVERATPTITWATPAPITYPTALSGAQLDAKASVAGTLTYSPASGTVLPAGDHVLSVTFAPSTTTNYTSTSATVALMVNSAATVVTYTNVTASPNPSVSGTTVTLEATVSPTTGGGTVTFSGAGISGCADEGLDSIHRATCRTSTLPVGTDVVTATYSGHASYDASSGSVTEKVTGNVTHTTVTASPNPSASGTAVTFRATVSPTTGRGTVTFSGPGISGCVNEGLDSNHRATCRTTALPVGRDVVVATYSGHASYDASSGSVTEVVTAAGLPSVASVSPDSGGAHDTVTVTGTNFNPHRTIVYFGGRQAPHIHVVSGTEVTCWSPVRSGTVDVTVKTPVGTSAVTNADRFTYVPPTVTSVAPDLGGNRTFVTVTGTNFISGDTVRFGGKRAPHVDVVSATEITVDSPFGSAGTTVDVTVSAPGTSATSPVTAADRYTYET